MEHGIKKRKCLHCHQEFQPTIRNQKVCPSCKTTPKHSIAERVEYLGRLNDEHRNLLDARNKAGLLALAEKYLQLKHPCTVMARAIRMQAESI